MRSMQSIIFQSSKTLFNDKKFIKGIGLQTFTCIVLDKQYFRKLNTFQQLYKKVIEI